jgi:uncharacterized repeat protein (TIGR01451 family)
VYRGPLLAAVLVVFLAALAIGLATTGGDSNGPVASESLAGAPVGPMDADLSLSIIANVSVADPGDQVFLDATAQNLGNETATNVTLEAPLDLNSTYIWSSPNATYDPLNRTLRWTVASLANGSGVDVFWTTRILVGTADNTTIRHPFRASYENATGAPLPPEEVVTTVRVRAPVFDPEIRPIPASAERGAPVVAKLYANNTGSGTALRAWSNWTLGGHFRFAYLEEAFPVTNVSNGFQVTLSNLAPGPHALTAHLVVLRGLDDGLSMGIQTQWTATDRNGNRLIPSTTGTSVDLLAPAFTLGMNASALRVNTSSRFVLTVTVRNTGRAPGIGWLNTTLPSGASFISDNGSFPRSIVGKRYSWTIPSVAAGTAVVLGITFESSSDSRVASFAFALEFTDGKGSPPEAVPGPRIDVEFVNSPASSAPPPLPGEWPIWALVAAAAGGFAASLLVWRRRRASDLQIEDVFVADMGGHLIAHRSSGLVAYEDEDILIGMFKVIQDFVHDSFARGTNDMMKSMEFGERKIIIERGNFHFISVVYRGRDKGSLSERVKKVSRLIDHRFGQALENWSGDLDELRGLATLLPQVWKHQLRSRAPAQVGPATPSAKPGSTSRQDPAAKDGGPADSDGSGVAVEQQE